MATKPTAKVLALPDLKSDQKRLTPSEIASRLRRQIQTGDLEPGAWLREVRLCADHGAARSAVREALRLLAEDGFVRLERNRGAQVADISIHEMFEMFETRAALFGLVVRFACFRAPDSLLQRALKKIDVMVEGAHRGAPARESIKRGIEIVALLTGAAPLETQRMMTSSNRKARWRYSVVGLATSARAAVSIKEWRALAAALRRRDADGAAHAARAVIYFMQQEVMQLMTVRGAAMQAS